MVSNDATPQSTDQAAKHEFINSLASVRCLTELLAAYPGLEEVDRIRFVSIMQEQTMRLIHLFNRLKMAPEAVEAG